jgi:hypothetical protein
MRGMGVRRGRSHEPLHHEGGVRAQMTPTTRTGRSLKAYGTGFAPGGGETTIGRGPGPAARRKMSVVPPAATLPTRDHPLLPPGNSPRVPKAP